MIMIRVTLVRPGSQEHYSSPPPPARRPRALSKPETGEVTSGFAVNAPHLVTLAHAGAAFINGKLIEWPGEETRPEAA
jgi:hypothetical protein